MHNAVLVCDLTADDSCRHPQVPNAGRVDDQNVVAWRDEVHKLPYLDASPVTPPTSIGYSALFPPTVLTDVTPVMDVFKQELFGPLAMVFKALRCGRGEAAAAFPG